MKSIGLEYRSEIGIVAAAARAHADESVPQIRLCSTLSKKTSASEPHSEELRLQHPTSVRSTLGFSRPASAVGMEVPLSVRTRGIRSHRSPCPPPHQPNKTPEPTPMSVTDRADARSAPATVVAHL
jgi:hypothetical protein